ncbi:hypothetical protein [Embleya sp. NPDC001921]
MRVLVTEDEELPADLVARGLRRAAIATMSKLRAKLGDHRVIRTVSGSGYVI